MLNVSNADKFDIVDNMDNVDIVDNIDNVDNISNLEKEVFFSVSQEDLVSFCKLVSFDYEFCKYHYQIIEKLEKIYKGELKNLLICLPPRAGKSRLVTQLFTSRVLGKNPKKKIIVAGYGQDLPNYFSRETQFIIDSEIYKEIFPNFRYKTKQVEHWETSKGGYYHAVGIGGPLTGYGFDIGIIDDPVKNREEAESVVYRNKIWNRYTSTFLTRKMDEKSAVIVILTRWHIDDLAGRILEKDLTNNREKIIVPAIDENKNSFRESKFSLQYLQEQKNVIGVRDFSALYMQDPIISTGSIFKPHDFKYFLLSDFEKVNGIQKKDIRLALFVDPAFSSSVLSDDAVVMVVGHHLNSNEYYVFDIYAETTAPSVTMEAIFLYADRWIKLGFNLEFISIENVHINKEQTKFINDFKNEMSLRNSYYKIYNYEPKMNKNDRIRFIIEPIMSNHKLFFIKGHGDFSAFKRLEEQLITFPTSKKDDIIDCLAQALHVFKNYGKQTKENKNNTVYSNKITGKIEKINYKRDNLS